MIDAEEIVKAYIDDPIDGMSPLGRGHINMSRLISAGDKYVLQRMSKDVFAGHLSELETDYMLYQEACAKTFPPGEWICPEWMRDRKGRYFHQDDEGGIWRLYRYIPGDAISGMPDPYAAGLGLGKIHRILRYRSCTHMKAVFPHLHDLKPYYDEYLKQEDSERQRDPKIDELISMNIDQLIQIPVPDGNVIHGDAKPDNMIFREGRAVGFIDLDTMMPGSLFNDIADVMRYCCEDENGAFVPAKADMILRGYEDGSEAELNDDAVELAGRTYIRNRFMLGLRYYTDYLAGNVYFTENHPGQSLEKARRLIVM